MEKASTSKQQQQQVCRVVFVMPQKARARRVAQLLQTLLLSHNSCPQEKEERERMPEENKAISWTMQKENVVIEYLPAVAVFGSYKEETTQQNVSYLQSVEYYGPQAEQTKPCSLLRFFEQDDPIKKNYSIPPVEQELGFSGISAVALGPGLEQSTEALLLGNFFETMQQSTRTPVKDNQKDDAKVPPPKMLLQGLTPNSEFDTLADEVRAFAALDRDEKERQSSQLHQLGPGKMAHFVHEFAMQVVRERWEEKQQQQAQLAQQQREAKAEPDPTILDTKTIAAPLIFDPTKLRFACRKCRTLLFGQDNLEDPPHSPGQHGFAAKKSKNPSANACQSIFLSSEQDLALWASCDLSLPEGRLACPKCQTKVGSWHWSGAQCSCGTWVVPAIQVPRSKVDEIVAAVVPTTPTTSETSHQASPVVHGHVSL